MTVEQVYEFILTAGGLTALVSLLVNVGKAVNAVKDGQAEVAVKLLNFIVFVGLFILGNSKAEADVWEIDAWAGTLAEAGTLLLPFFIAFGNWLSPKIHEIIKGTPLVGYSHSA